MRCGWNLQALIDFNLTGFSQRRMGRKYDLPRLDPCNHNCCRCRDNMAGAQCYAVGSYGVGSTIHEYCHVRRLAEAAFGVATNKRFERWH